MSVYAGPNTVQSGLVLHIDPSNPRSYPGSGSTVFDLSGNNNNGTLTNGASVINTRGGRALDFDGVNDVVSVPLPQVTGLTQCTLATWYRRTQQSTRAGLVGFGVASSGANRFSLQPWSDGVVYISMRTNDWGYFSNNDTNWHSLIAVFNGNNSTNDTRLRVYFDGVRQTLSFTGTIPTTTGTPTSFRIGQTHNPSDQFGDGQIDDVRVYNRALTESEIRQLFESKRGKYL